MQGGRSPPQKSSDNYDKHENGRLWIGWDPRIWEIKNVMSSEQYLHSEVYLANGTFSHYMTAIYALNQLSHRKNLWNDIQSLGDRINMPWIIIGDYNNVLKVNDRMGGNEVQEYEYRDLENMMEAIGVYEHETQGPHFTWSNKHSQNLIHSRIDRALCNSLWFTKFQDSRIDVLNPHISDHSPLKVWMDRHNMISRQKRRFKFLNCVTEKPEFMEILRSNWQQEIEGRPMYKLWRKLFRLQPELQKLNR
ncbi:uncharacterized protein LOC131597960 [Vicia villosa]|uniref:uncharacterized protein LOC131597960 n=1 Tax=Vicia villosa TaxID=3911 RepID=UPI00273C6199|nr:uncharacterized protein LOC131597960 [Vicia villosa]